MLATPTPTIRARAATTALVAALLLHTNPVAGTPDPGPSDATPASGIHRAASPPVSSGHHEAQLRTGVPDHTTIPGVRPERRDTTPHLLQSPFADVLVRVRGSRICSGTPLTGTTYVVTAAHCVLDHDGTVAPTINVLRDGASYRPTSVLVDAGYHTSPSPLTDAAVLDMNQTIPGRSAILGTAFPTDATVTLAGYQPIDTDGSLLRGSRYDNTPTPHATTGSVIHIAAAPAGCTLRARIARITDTQVSLPCGLIQGASGGGGFTEHNHQLTVVGIISTVDFRITRNGLVPLAALQRLLDNPAVYSHQLPTQTSTRSRRDLQRH